VLLAVAGGDLASAQKRRGAQANNNAAQAPQKTERQKRVIVGRGTDTAKGSRVSIMSDDTLTGYSSYRSGDRLYVVLPKANAGAISKGASGKGYSDMQVQQRGSDVVVSYRVQPGAKSRVEQKFNRLDVVFDVPSDSQGGATGSNATNRTTNPPANQTANQQTQNPSTQNVPPIEKRPAQSAGGVGQQGTTAPVVTTPPVVATQQPTGVGQTAPDGTQPPATIQTAQTPVSTPPIEQQIARAEPPNTIAPITTTNPATSTSSGSSLGTYLLQNWWMALVLALVVVGLGLVIAARRTSAAPPAPLEESKAAATTKTALDASRASLLKGATAAATLSAAESKKADALKPADVAASTVTVKESKNAKKKLKKKAEKSAKKKGAWAEELAAVEEPSVESVETAAVEEATVIEPVAAETAVAEPSVAEPVLAESVVAEPVVAEPVAEEVAAVDSAVEEVAVEDAPVEDVAVEDATPAIEAAKEIEVAETVEAAKEVEAAEEVETASFATTEIIPVAATLIAPAVLGGATSDTGIAPVVALDPDNVQAEARRVLQGDAYDEAVVGSSDSMARQMIAAELLSALAGRNPERRARARTAFIKHGYFDEKSRDLSEAEAPAERAAAARSLALVSDRAATPHLVAALEDRSTDVRRAAVEALGALRDPSAVAPLESLQEREKKQRDKIPPRVIRNAVETCREAAEEMRASAQPAIVEPATVVESAQLEPLVESSQLEPPVVEEAIAEAPAFEEAIGAVEESVNEATADVEPLEIAGPVAGETVAIEPVGEDVASVVEAAPAIEDMPVEAAEETTLELEPFEIERDEETAIEPSAVEEITVETAPVEEFEIEIAPVEEASAISAIEAVPEASEETPVAEIEPQHFDEPQLFESAVAEPELVVPDAAQETGIQPSAQDRSTSIEFVEPSVTEAAAQDFEIAGPGDESRQVTLFDESATAASSVVEIEEATVAAPVESDVASLNDEWVDLDVHETHFGEQPGAVESSDEIETSAFYMDSSTVETMTTAVVPSEAGPTFGEDERAVESAEKGIEESFAPAASAGAATVADFSEKGVAPFDEFSTVPASIQQKLGSRVASERAAAITELSHVDSDEAFQQICAAFDDEAKEVRGAAARALYELRTDRAESFTRALREATAERRRSIGAALSSSGLAGEAISQLTGESREKTYEAFSLLFLMAKAGEVQPLIRAIEGHPNNEVRLAVVKLLALSGQKEILPAFRRLAVRGSLPTEVRSAVMEAIYQISSSQPSAA
jgi:HEAT repeat protein